MNKIFKGTIIVSILSLIEKVLAFLRDVAIASRFGANWQTDAYNMAITVINIVYSVIGIALTTSLIPLIAKVDKEEGDEGVNKLCSNSINIFIILSVTVIVIVNIFAPSIVSVIAPGYNTEGRDLTVLLIKISSFNIMSMCINSVFNAFLQYRQKFLFASLSGVIVNLLIVAAMVIIPDMTIRTLVMVTLMANYIQLALQLPWLIKNGFRYKLKFEFSENIKYLFISSIPLLLGVCTTQVNSIIDKGIASTLPEGSVSAISYAFKLVSLPHLVFGYAIIIVIFPHLAKLFNESKNDLFDILYRTTVYLCMIMIFITGFFIIMDEEIIKVFFGYGSFDKSAIEMTATALFGYSFGIACLAIKDLYIRIFYISRNNKYVMKMTILTVILNIVLIITLVDKLGVLALTLSTSISAIIVTISSYNKVKKILNVEKNTDLLRCIIKIILVTVITLVPLKMIYNIFMIKYTISSLLLLPLFGVISVIVFILILSIARIREFDDILKKIKEIIKVKK